MASRKENLKSLFSNTRTRVIIIFTIILLVIAVGIGYVKLRNASGGVTASSALPEGPAGIQSIPGVLDPTAQYAKLQEQQNITQAKQAETSGGSAIPTIIRTQALGEGVGVVGSSNGQSGVGFTALAREDQEGTQSSLWIQDLKNGSCSKSVIDKVVSQGAQLSDLKAACTCVQLKDTGYALQDLDQICQCKELKAAGFSARQLKDIGYSAGRLRACGFDACELRNAGFTAQQMKDGGFSDGELKGAGFSDAEIAKASGLPDGITAADVRNAGCNAAALTKLRKAGVTASAIRRISGCSAEQLKAAGFTAQELKDAGFSAADLKKAGFTADQLKAAGFNARDLLNAGFTPEELAKAGFTAAQIKAAQMELPPGITPADVKNAGCDVDSLKKAKAAGVSALTIKQTLGCSAQALKDAGYSAKELRDAGFTAAELKGAGFSAKDLKNAGFTAKELGDAGFSAQQLKAAGFSARDLKDAGFSAAELKAAGFSAAQLKAAGFSAKDLKDAGFSAADLKAAGYSAKDLKDAGYSAADLKAAGYSAKDLKDAGYSAQELKDAGFTKKQLLDAGFSPQDSGIAGLDNPNLQQNPSNLNTIPTFLGNGQQASTNDPNGDKLQAILNKQNQQLAEQKYQQKIQQRTSEMLGAATQAVQGWKQVSTQVYTESTADDSKDAGGSSAQGGSNTIINNQNIAVSGTPQQAAIKTGDIVFAVLDTAVNSDEPGPILATIVSGKLKGTKLIGSFNLPSTAEKMVITFNTMSIPGAAKTISISAFAIDPNTARTALSSRTDHHFLMRYGSLFASSFLQGFGNAFQSANTTVTIGGTGGGNNITVSNGIGRSALENAVIGLAQVGQNWSQQAQQLFNTPTTVEVYSGTGIGVLFTQDVQTI